MSYTQAWYTRFLAVLFFSCTAFFLFSGAARAEGYEVSSTDKITITRVSVSSSSEEGNGLSSFSRISYDGRFVSFYSDASNLVVSDTNKVNDVFVHDRQTGETTRVSISSDGEQGNSASFFGNISADGRFVVFMSHATNLVPGDTNKVSDAFVHDRQTGVTTRVSISSDGEQGNGEAGGTDISADGRFVVLVSRASNLVSGDTNNRDDIFVRDRQTGVTTRVSVSSDGEQGSDNSFSGNISADGRFVSFVSLASNLVTGDTNNKADMFVHDRQTGETTRVSISSDGEQGNESSLSGDISASGMFVVFISGASNLVPNDTNNWENDVFVHDRQTGVTSLVSISSNGEQGRRGALELPDISADGRFVVFASVASNLVTGDINATSDVFIHDRQTGQTNLVSTYLVDGHDYGPSSAPSISADGRYVSFGSASSSLIVNDTNLTEDIFVYEAESSPPDTTYTVSGRITDAAGNGIPYARITNGLGEYFTTADGTYSITGLPAGTYTIAASLPGTAKQFVPRSKTVTVGPAATGVNFTEQVPIILVPGTGASMNMPCFFVDEAFCINNSVSKALWHWFPHPLIGKQVAGIYYEPLLETLRASGYTEFNGYLEVFHYDWRKPAAGNGQLLDQRIKDVQSNTGAPVVDLITHSQGGLVARTYIQGSTYANNVRNVFFGGVPHQGVTKVYYFWEGGQVVTGDSRLQNEAVQLLINQVYKKDLEDHVSMFHRVFPSFQGMLPTYNYLRRNNELIQNNTLVWQNTTLPTLNDNSGLLFGRATVYNFVGTGTQTRQILTLGDANPSLSAWPDGQVIGENLDTQGDGTVTQQSATLDMLDHQVTVTSSHSDILLKETTQSVIFGVLGLPVPVEVHAAAEVEDTNLLYIAISGTVEITVTNALGKHVSNSSSTIPDAVYVHEDGYSQQMVMVPHTSGNYTVTVEATSGTAYTIGVLTSATAQQQQSGTFFDAWDVVETTYSEVQQFLITQDGTKIEEVSPHTSQMSVYLPLIQR